MSEEGEGVGRAVPCQPTSLSSGPGTACSLGPGQHGPACHRAGPCLCRAKKAGFVPCRRASGCMDIYGRIQTPSQSYGIRADMVKVLSLLAKE